MKDAFKKNPGLHADGLVHVTTQTSLYSFFPIYNAYTVTCTTVKGIPIRFDHSAAGFPLGNGTGPKTGISP